MKNYDRCFYPLVRQYATGKISRKMFEHEWKYVQQSLALKSLLQFVRGDTKKVLAAKSC